LPITTTSDVYSLGVVLYELLTGERPYKIESRLPEEVAQIILTQEPVKPSDWGWRMADCEFANKSDATNENQNLKTNKRNKIRNPQSAIRNLKGDLDNIILKALRKEPERRYQSVQEFSEDIRRHLVGLPVTATADTLLYRLNKFVRRHRTGVLAGVLVILILLGATAITAWQAVVARREQAKAEQRFREVRKLANTILFEYHDGIAKLPGSTSLREKMVKDALLYLDNLAAENINDASLQSELASAYFKVGEVQGAPAKSSLGDYGGGLESFRKSLAIREKLFREKSPNDAQIKLDLSRSYQMVGHLSQVTDDLPAAFENYGKAFALLNEMPDARRDLATLHTRFAQALSASGKLPEAIENFRKSHLILSELMAQNPDERELKRDLGKTSVLLGDALEESSDLEKALETQRNAYAILQPLVIENDTDSNRAALSAFGRIGDVLFKMGKYAEALEIQLKTLAVDEKTLAVDPNNAQARRDVQVDFHKIALNYSGLGKMNEALASERKTVEFCEKAVSANPESSESRNDLSVAYYHYAEMLEKSGNLREALNFYKKATEIEEANANADPTNTTAMSNLSESYLKIGDTSMKLGNRADALKIYLKGLEIREKLAANKQDTAQDRPITAKLYESLGDFYFPQDKQKAKSHYEQSLAIWQDLQRGNTILESDAKKPDEVKKKIEKCSGYRL
jgi:tetratricopeptide (TPR) repeat protein